MFKTLIFLKWSNDLFFISKVQISDVVFKELFWCLPQHMDPVTSFLLTLRHILRSYCPNSPTFWGETGKICPSVYAISLVRLKWWSGCDERRRTEEHLPSEILRRFLTSTAGPRLAPHPRGPKNLPLFQAQPRSMSCWNGSSCRAVSPSCISRLLRKLLGRWRFA